MPSFMEFLAQSRRMALPVARTMLAMAGVPLGCPDEEETQRLLNGDRKQRPAGGKAHHDIIPLDSQPPRRARKRI